jgi:hypothetical protein
MDEKPADSARVQRFVSPPLIVTRNPSVDNERARRSQFPIDNPSTKPDSRRRPRAKHRCTTQVNHEATLHIYGFQKAKRDNVRDMYVESQVESLE